MYANSQVAELYTLEGYLANKLEIEDHNSRNDSGYSKEINQFTGIPKTLLMKENVKGLGRSFKCPTEATVFST